MDADEMRAKCAETMPVGRPIGARERQRTHIRRVLDIDRHVAKRARTDTAGTGAEYATVYAIDGMPSSSQPSYVKMPTGIFLYPRDFTEDSTASSATLRRDALPTPPETAMAAIASALPGPAPLRIPHGLDKTGCPQLLNMLLARTPVVDAGPESSESGIDFQIGAMDDHREAIDLLRSLLGDTTVPLRPPPSSSSSSSSPRTAHDSPVVFARKSAASFAYVAAITHIFLRHMPMTVVGGKNALAFESGVLPCITARVMVFWKQILGRTAQAIELAELCPVEIAVALFKGLGERLDSVAASTAQGVEARVVEVLWEFAEPADEIIRVEDALFVRGFVKYLVGDARTYNVQLICGTAYILKSQLRRLVVDALRDPAYMLKPGVLDGALKALHNTLFILYSAFGLDPKHVYLGEWNRKWRAKRIRKYENLEVIRGQLLGVARWCADLSLADRKIIDEVFGVLGGDSRSISGSGIIGDSFALSAGLKAIVAQLEAANMIDRGDVEYKPGRDLRELKAVLPKNKRCLSAMCSEHTNRGKLVIIAKPQPVGDTFTAIAVCMSSKHAHTRNVVAEILLHSLTSPITVIKK